MKTALVCDFLTKFGGAQQVLLTLHEIYPDAPIYCLLYDKEGTKGKFANCNIIQSSLANLPLLARKNIKYLLPKLPRVVEEFDFSDFDMVISSSDSYCHGIITKPSTFHLCYCHTPMRYAWDWYNEYLDENNIGFGAKGLIVRDLLHKIRIWDRIAADRVDQYIANSENVASRIKKYYQKESTVIYPPVIIPEAKQVEKEDYYIIVSRLEPYKRVKLAIEAFNDLGLKLKIIGEGTEGESLKSVAGKNIEFLGWVSEEKKFDLLRKAKAFIFPGEEDFGITPVEAMSVGTPVIAFSKGGVKESVDQKTGLFFDEENKKSLMAAINKFEDIASSFKSETCIEQAKKFSQERFKESFQEFANKSYEQYRKRFL